MNALHEELEMRALAFARENAIAHPGDLVLTKWGNWKRPRQVRITSIGAHLVCRWNQIAWQFEAGFDMTYVAHRIRKDGTSAKRVPESGICLDNLETTDGRKWTDRIKGLTWFNHSGLCWEYLSDHPVPPHPSNHDPLPVPTAQERQP